MLNLRFMACTFPLVLNIALDTGTVFGQNYPNKPIRLIGTEPGGTGDLIARLIAPGLSDLLGQQVIVDSRPGLLGMEAMAKAPPDGYTLTVLGSGNWVRPLLEKLPYDPVTDCSPISLLTMQPNVLVVPPSLPVKSVQELIALAKARPGELSYASSGTSGGSSHISAELFKAMAGVNIVRISYRGGGPGLAYNDLMGERVQLMFASAPSAAPLIKSGKLRALAVSSAEPSALFPGLPTVAASGLPGYAAGNAAAMFAQLKTPEAIIKRLNQEVVRVLARPDIKEKFFNNAAEPVGSSPAQLAAMLKSERAKLGKVIKDAGIKGDYGIKAD